MRSWIERLKSRASVIRRDAVALYLATRDPRVPWYAKGLAALIAAYALSPIDLIPDFIPVLGYLDELILLPLAMVGVVRLIDPAIMAEHRATASQRAERPTSKVGAVLIAGIWVLSVATSHMVASPLNSPPPALNSLTLALHPISVTCATYRMRELTATNFRALPTRDAHHDKCSKFIVLFCCMRSSCLWIATDLSSL